jgi:hypothetical protein
MIKTTVSGRFWGHGLVLVSCRRGIASAPLASSPRSTETRRDNYSVWFPVDTDTSGRILAPHKCRIRSDQGRSISKIHTFWDVACEGPGRCFPVDVVLTFVESIRRRFAVVLFSFAKVDCRGIKFVVSGVADRIGRKCSPWCVRHRRRWAAWSRLGRNSRKSWRWTWNFRVVKGFLNEVRHDLHWIQNRWSGQTRCVGQFWVKGAVCVETFENWIGQVGNHASAVHLFDGELKKIQKIWPQFNSF